MLSNSDPSPSYRRQDDLIRGRHLIATRQIQKHELIFCERPLCSLQSIENVHKGALVCRACRAFCGGASICLKLASGSLKREDVFEEEPALIPCRQSCGEVFCSVECEQDFWPCHAFLCTGPIKDEDHPLLEWKRHAILNNEIFLLVGDVVSAILAYPELMADYTDFTLVPWWTVALLPYINQPANFADGVVLESSCRRLCDQSAALLNQALKMQGVETDFVTPLFIAQIIGSFEQNSIGIRARHPLCRDILENDELRLCHLEDIVCCLESAGFTDDASDADDEVCHDCPDEQDADVEARDGVPMMEDCNREADMSVVDVENYTSDDITEFLGSLNIDETDGGDDLDALFAPLDGTAMYSHICKMNHSCNPNVVVIYRGLRWHEPLVAQCVAMRDIEPDEELCISYIDAAQSIEVRERELANYGFECACDKCCMERVGLSCPSIASATSELVMECDDQNFVGEDGESAVPTVSPEDVLRQKVEELKAAADVLPQASIPPQIFAEAHSFVINHGTNALSLLGESSELSDDIIDCLARVKLQHFGACIAEGCDLLTHLSNLMDQNGSWTNGVYQSVLCVASIVSSIGMAHVGSFLAAQALLDKATVMGLRRSSIETFFEYVEKNANQSYRGVLVARNIVCKVPLFSSIGQVFTKFMNFGLTEVEAVSKTFNSVVETCPIIMRGYAAHWDVISTWNSLSWFARWHGHRILSLKSGQVFEAADSKPNMMTMRCFVSKVLVPSCAHNVWSLQDCLLHPSACMVEDHDLLEQVPELLQHIDVDQDFWLKTDPSKRYIWMRSGGTRTCIQLDFARVMMVQIVGATYVRLYPRDEGAMMHISNSNGEAGHLCAHLFNCELDDFEAHSLVRDSVYKEAVLLPGDSLFIPTNVCVYTRALSTSVGVTYKW